MAHFSSITYKEIAASFRVSFEMIICKHVFQTLAIYQSRQLPVCAKAIGAKVRTSKILLEAPGGVSKKN